MFYLYLKLTYIVIKPFLNDILLKYIRNEFNEYKQTLKRLKPSVAKLMSDVGVVFLE